jgi:glycosyltransferase involved in cell wall biosynthesis
VYEIWYESTINEGLTWICEPGVSPAKTFLASLADKMCDESVMWSFCGLKGDTFFEQEKKSWLLSEKQFIKKYKVFPFTASLRSSSLFRSPQNKQRFLSLFATSDNRDRTFLQEIARGGSISYRADVLNKSTQQSLSVVQKSAKPRIAMCGTGFISGGGETFPIRLANFIKRAGYTVTFVNFDCYPRNEGIRRMLDSDIPVVNLLSLRSLGSIVENYGFDIIHSHNATIDVIISEANLPTSVKHVVTLHGMYECKGQEHLARSIPKLLETVGQWVYTADKNLDAFKPVAGFAKKQFTKIGNGLEIKAAKSVDLSLFGINANSFIVCLASRAIREKGWSEAIEIVGAVRKKTQKDVQLVLLGDGPLFEYYKNKAPKYAHCVGFQENVAGFFAMSDVFLFPTTFAGESFPLVILDALSVGTPVIASSIGEIQKMLTNRQGEVAGDVFSLDSEFRVPLAHVEEILVRYLTDSEYLQNKSQIALELVKSFDMAQVAQNYLRLYTDPSSGPRDLGIESQHRL